MCGIAGLLRTDGAPVSAEALAALVAALAHRGPDGEGVRLHGPMAIGHRRLAIVDPAGGRQPLGSEDGQVWAVCNGEIYNHLDLRRELEARGHRFATASDNEVVVHGYEEWGDACVERLRGMFALAVMDQRRGRLLLARDQLGIKPLLYARVPGGFAFASELQALRRLPGIDPAPDLEAIDQYLALQYIPAPRTALRAVRKLAPGERLVLELDGTLRGPETYWRLVFRPQAGRSADEWAAATDAVVAESVRAHLMSDVPYGAFLSGGVDSSAVVAHMSRILDQPVRTFSIGFDDPEHNELAHADQVARRWGTTHHAEVVRPQVLDLLPDLVRHHGEPFGDSSAVPTWLVSRLARRSVAMVLSGDGGDESFAGYRTYQHWLQWLSGAGQPAWRRGLRALASTLLPGRWPPRRPHVAAWLRLVAYLATDERRRLWRPDLRRHCGGAIEAFERAARDVRSDAGPLAMVQRLDLSTYLPEDILAKVDIASMAHGLEVRTPLVDVRVVEFAATIPPGLQLARDASGAWAGKLLLKKTLEGIHPPAFLQRAKQGFAVPLARWFEPGGQLHAALHERVLAGDSPLAAWFEPAAIARLVRARRHGPLWLLLVLDEWLRQQRVPG